MAYLLPTGVKNLLAHVWVLLVKREFGAGDELLLAVMRHNAFPRWQALILGQIFTGSRTSRIRPLGIWKRWLNDKTVNSRDIFPKKKEGLSIPDGEGSFVHLHAHQEGIFGKLDSGDEVQRCFCFKADLHTGSHEVHVHCNVASDH